MVAKYRRQVRTGEIGVIRADMSVANSLGQISNAVNKMSNEAFKMAADTAEKRGRDYISSKSDDEIFGIDPETGKPKNLMTELLADLPAKGYGMIAQDAIKSEAAKRFGLILETKFREQGANAQAKFPLNPGKASAMLEEFTDELASKYEGEYKNKILSYGTSFTSGVRNTLLIRQANNQIQIGMQNTLRTRDSFLQNEVSVAESASNQATVDKMLAEAENPTGSKLKDIIQSSNSANTFSGGKVSSGNQFKLEHKSAIAVARIKGIMRKYSTENLLPLMTMVRVANGDDIEKIEGLSVDDNKNIKAMFQHVVAYDEGRSNLSSALKGMIANQNVIDTYRAQQDKQNQAEIIAGLDDEAYNQRIDLLSYQSGKNYNDFSQKIDSLPSIQSKIEFANQVKSDIRAKGTTILERTENGKKVKASKSILTDGEINKINNAVDKVVSRSVSSELVGAFTENGVLQTADLRRVVSAIVNNGVRGTTINTGELTKNMTSRQKKAVESIVPSITKARPVGPGGVETTEGGLPNLEIDARTAIANHLKTEINNANQLASEMSAQRKVEQFASSVATKTFIGSSPENSNQADQFILAVASEDPALAGKSVKDILMSAQFADPESKIRKTFDNLLRHNGVVSTETKELISELRNGFVTGPAAQRFLDFVVKGTTLVGERDADGAIRYVELNMFRVDKETHEDVMAIQEAFKISQITGGQLGISQILIREREYLNSPQYETKLKAITGEDTAQAAHKKIREAIAKTDGVIAAGGNGSTYHEFLMKAIPHVIFKNKDAFITVDDLERFATATMKDFYGPTEDFVLDPLSVSIKGVVRSSMALNRLFPNDETKEAFLDYAQAKLETLGDYDIRQGDRGGIQGRGGGSFFGSVMREIPSVLSGMPFVSTFMGDKKSATLDSSGQMQVDSFGSKKAWLVPSQFASTDPYTLSDDQNVSFFLSEGILGGLSFIMNDKNVGKVSFKEFRHYQKTGEFLPEDEQ